MHLIDTKCNKPSEQEQTLIKNYPFVKHTEKTAHVD